MPLNCNNLYSFCITAKENKDEEKLEEVKPEEKKEEEAVVLLLLNKFSRAHCIY